MLPTAVQILFLDVDGVMTDGSVLLDDLGVETKRFHVRDGTGLRMWMAMGYHVALITGRTGKALQYRAKELGIEHVRQGVSEKAGVFREILEELGLNAAQAAMLGDDLPDVPILRLVGYPMAVSDAVGPVRALSRYVTSLPGGRGAVREAIEHLLHAKGELERAATRFG